MNSESRDACSHFLPRHLVSQGFRVQTLRKEEPRRSWEGSVSKAPSFQHPSMPELTVLCSRVVQNEP